MAARSRLSTRRAGLAVASLVISAVFVLQPLGLAQAQASTSCVYDSESVNVTLVGEPVTLSVSLHGEILVDGLPCEEADDPFDDVVQRAYTDNTSIVNVFGTGGVDDVTIDQSEEDRWFPGTIAFSLMLEKDPDDILQLDLSDSKDVVLGDPYALFLYGDRSGEVSLNGVDQVEIEARDGDDVIHAGDPDGDVVVDGSLNAPDPGPLVPSITIWGGNDQDFLVGGEGDDHLYGQDGPDWLDGMDGTDVLIGGDDQDVDVCLFADGYLPCDPTLELQPPAASVGTPVVATGAGWYPENGPISIAFPATGSSVVAQDPGPDGSFSKKLDVPPGDSATTVSACQQCDNIEVNWASTTFEYAPPPVDVTLGIKPRRVVDGQAVTVSGSGWTPGERVLMLLDKGSGAGEALVADATPGEDTLFVKRFVVDDLDPGVYPLVACQMCDTNDEKRTQRRLRVVAAPGVSTIRVEPDSASVGESFTVKGEAWRPDLGDVSVQVRGAPAATGEVVPVAALADGSFVVRLDVPDVAAGSHTVVACQRCDSPERIEARKIVSILAAPADPPWWSAAAAKKVAAASLMAVLAAAASIVWLRTRRPSRPRKPPGGGHVHARLSDRAAKVSVTTVGDGSFDHVVRLVPVRDLGVQRVEEVSLR